MPWVLCNKFQPYQPSVVNLAAFYILQKLFFSVNVYNAQSI